MNEESLFAEALGKKAEARAAFLDEHCKDDAQLRKRLDALLRAGDNPDPFLEAPAPVVGATVDEPMQERPGTVIGPYKLLEQIGEGGFGVVFMAEQQEPVRRKVALKVLKPGMDTRQVVARFEAERQALAVMDHPNIAKVLDAGTVGSRQSAVGRQQEQTGSLPTAHCLLPTDEGRPYFVMELVKGLPITEFCDQNHLPIRERLELFVNVCQAVQHAHQKGIIHRDLKPSNILVASHDGTPVPKVIDFGIAKAMSGHLTDKTLVTGFAQMMGTPLYMSPEQAGQSALDVDTRSDIYSLGVLLYELLTGATPFDKEQLSKLGYDEMRRIIHEEEPPKPSKHLSETWSAERKAPSAENGALNGKGASRSALRALRFYGKGASRSTLRALRFYELDWIVMKALDKDRNRRYETANGFAADVQRYLKDEPVQACPPSVGYRLRKFVRRNKSRVAVAGLALLFLFVVGGLVGWTLSERSSRQARLARQVELILDEVEGLSTQEKWPEALAAANRAEAALQSGDADPATQHRLQQALKDLKMVQRLEEIRLSASQTEGSNTFDWRGADRAYAAAFRDYGIDVQTLPEPEAGKRLQSHSAVAVPLAVALDNWADTQRKIAKPEDANWKRLIAVAGIVDPEPTRNRLRALWGRKITDQTKKELIRLAEPERLSGTAPTTLVLLARTLKRAGLSAEQLRVLRQAQQRYPADFWLNFELGNADAAAFYRVALAIRPGNEAVQNNLAIALMDQGKLDEAISLHRKNIAAAALNRTWSLNNLGECLRRKGKLDKAIACFHKAIDLDPRFAPAYENLGRTLLDQGKVPDAIARYHKAIDLNPKSAAAHANLAEALRRQGKRGEAIPLNRKAIELDPKCIIALTNLGLVLAEENKLEEAVACHKKALEIDPKDAVTHHNFGTVLFRQNKLDEAIGSFHKSLDLDQSLAEAHMALAAALERQGKRREATLFYRKAAEIRPADAVIHTKLANALKDQGEFEEAIKCYRKAIEIDPKNAATLNRLGLVLKRQEKVNEAIECFRKGLEIDSKNVVILNNLGLSLRKQNKLKEAIACYRQALEIGPNDIVVLFNLGIAWEEKNLFQDAITCYRAALKSKPNWAPAYFRLGNALKAQGKLDQAIAAYRQAGEKHPTFVARANFNIGVLTAKQHRHNEAAAAYQKVIEKEPKHREALTNLALLLTRANDSQLRNLTAVPLARKAVQLDGKNANSWRVLSLACYRANDWQGSLEARAEVMRLTKKEGPNDCFWQAMIHWQLGRKEDARRWYDKALTQMQKMPLPTKALLDVWREAEELLGDRPPRAEKKKATK